MRVCHNAEEIGQAIRDHYERIAQRKRREEGR